MLRKIVWRSLFRNMLAKINLYAIHRIGHLDN